MPIRPGFLPSQEHWLVLSWQNGREAERGQAFQSFLPDDWVVMLHFCCSVSGDELPAITVENGLMAGHGRDALVDALLE